MAYERRSFAGAGANTTLAAGINDSTLTITITDATGWPTGSAGDYFAVIDLGTASEEKVRIDTRSSTTLTVLAGGRGADGTVGVAHSIGATISLCLTALDLDEANAHIANTALDHHTQYVNKSLYDANSILIATADNTPIALPVAASRFVGRKATGDIDDMTAAEASTLLASAIAAEAALAAVFVARATFPVVLGFALSDETTAITTGTAKLTARAPFAFTLTGVRASLNTASSSGIPTVDVNEAGTTVLSTKLTIDANEKTSTTAATAAVISDSAIADDAELTFDIDVAGTGAKGLKVYLIGTRVI